MPHLGIRSTGEGEGETPSAPECNLTFVDKDTTWTNCCSTDRTKTAAENCPKSTVPIPGMVCPETYQNCADPANQIDMCTSDRSGYSEKFPSPKKCCPSNYSCGPAFDSMCAPLDLAAVRDSANITNNLPILSQPLYLKRAGIFSGCNDDQKISPEAIGGIVAVAIILFVSLCAAGLWFVRNRLYRDPNRARQRSLRKAKLAEFLAMEATKDSRDDSSSMAGSSTVGKHSRSRSMSSGRKEHEPVAMGMGMGMGITVTSEIKVERGEEEKGERHDLTSDELDMVVTPPPRAMVQGTTSERWAKFKRTGPGDRRSLVSPDEELLDPGRPARNVSWDETSSVEDIVEMVDSQRSPGRVPKLNYRT